MGYINSLTHFKKKVYIEFIGFISLNWEIIYVW